MGFDSDLWGGGRARRPHHFVVLGAGEAGLARAEVVGVLDEGLVVGAHVEGDGHDAVRGDPAAGRVERQLADGDAHAVDAQVAQAEDSRAVGDDNHVDVVLRPVVDHGGEVPAVVAAEIHAARAAKLVPKLLADRADGRRVDERRHGLDIVYKQVKIQGFIPILEVLQIPATNANHQTFLTRRRMGKVHVFGLVVWLCSKLPQYSLDLIIQSLDSWRQQTTQP